MEHLNEYEENDIDSLLGDLADLGIAKDRVYIEFFENKNFTVYDPLLTFEVFFPKFNRIKGEITESDIVKCIRDKEFKFISYLSSKELAFNRRYKIDSDEIKFIRAIDSYKTSRFRLGGFLYNLCEINHTYAEIRLVINGENIMEFNNEGKFYGKKDNSRFLRPT